MNAPPALDRISIRAAPLADAKLVARIDAYARGHEQGTLFHRPAWMRAVERGCGQAAHCLVAEDREGRVRGIAPANAVRSPLFGSALVSCAFGVGGGILADGEAVAARLAEAFWTSSRTLGCGEAELRGGWLPPGWEREEGVHAHFVRELPPDEEAILKSIRRKQRAEVRRSLRLGLEIETGTGPALRDAHYRVYAESVRNLGTPVFPRALFEAMLECFGDDADILAVVKGGRPVAAVLSFYFGGTAMPYWGGGTREARALRANEAMYHALMVHAARRGCARFDFGRSKLGTGAYAYKKNWGFEPEPIVYARRGGRGKSRSVNPLDPRYRLPVALWKRLPIALANRLGPPIARGLG